MGGAFWLSNQCPYAYSYNDLKTVKMSERQTAYFKIKDTFGTSNMVALVLPSGDYEAEAKILSGLDEYEILYAKYTLMEIPNSLTKTTRKHRMDHEFSKIHIHKN